MPKTHRITKASVPRRTRKSNTSTQRAYQGIVSGRLSPYKGEYRSSDTQLYGEQSELIARARELAQNDGVVTKFAKLLSANVIGSNGITVKPKAVDPSGKLDTRANDIISANFSKWCKYPTVDNSYSWIDVQRVCVESLVRDGEVFVRIYRGKDFGKYQIQLQILPPDYVDIQYCDYSRGIRNGIEYDRFNRPVAYHIYNRNPQDRMTNLPLLRERVTANDCIHFYLRDTPQQSRGVPLISPVMSQILDLKHYKYLELVAARVGAGTQGFITQTADGKGKWRGNEDNEATKGVIVEPGTLQELPPGCDIKTYDPNHPNGNYPAYTQTIARDIASGLGVSYNDLFSDLNSVTYSSLRWGALSDREQYKMFQRLIIDTLLEPIYLYWVEMACLTGNLTDGKLTLPYSKIEKYSVAQFRPRSYPWIDPLKDAQATSEQLKNQSTTITKVLEEQGYDLEDILKERQREAQLSNQYGVDLSQIYSAKTQNSGEQKQNGNQAE